MAAIVIGATAAACGSDTTTTPTPPTFNATLNGANEVPPKAVAGTGTAAIVKNGTTYTYTVNYSGLSGSPTLAHIHGPGGTAVAVGVLVSFTVPAGLGTTGTLTGTFTSADNNKITTDSLDALMTSGNAYVNVHTALNGGGEIRGQLSKQP
jgi:hypothetical protein